MELDQNNEKVFNSCSTIEEIVYRLKKYSNDNILGSFEIKSTYRVDSGVQVANLLLEKYSLRNSSFMMIIINVVDEGTETSKVF